MCTLITLYRSLEGYHVVAMFNRYAPRRSQVEAPPRLVKGRRYLICCPVDVASGGTWVGFNEAGLFAAVTDQHSGPVIKPRRSRGLLLLDVLGGFSDSREAADYVRHEVRKGYITGNFVVADEEAMFHVIYDGQVHVRELGPGAHVFTNLTMTPNVDLSDELIKAIHERAEARRTRAVKLLSGWEPSSLAEALEKLKTIAADHGDSPGRKSICYHDSGDWKMTSSTILAVSHDFERSKVLYCPGNPCSSAFVDYSHVLSAGPGEVSRKSDRLAGRRIALCVTGSSAATEAPKLARELRRHGAEVICYMTPEAARLIISPEVMRWATGRPVVLELTGAAEHIADYDLVVVYPATFNTICKIAAGIADNAVASLCAATPPDKLVLAPAMNLKLYGSPILREALNKLATLGVKIAEPRVEEGAAKVAEKEAVVDLAIRTLSTSRLKGRGVLVLAGPTRYDLDAVRYISNKSSGALGFWLAKEAFWRGCRVKVVFGPGTVRFPRHIPVIKAYTVEDMLNAALGEFRSGGYDIAIFAAAILDFKPERTLDMKLKSGAEWAMKLVPTPKVIEAVRREFPDLFVVGFKLEYKVSDEELVASARKLLEKLDLNVVVANDLTQIRAGRHRALLVTADSVKEVDGPKSLLAKEIFDLVEELF